MKREDKTTRTSSGDHQNMSTTVQCNMKCKNTAASSAGRQAVSPVGHTEWNSFTSLDFLSSVSVPFYLLLIFDHSENEVKSRAKPISHNTTRAFLVGSEGPTYLPAYLYDLSSSFGLAQLRHGKSRKIPSEPGSSSNTSLSQLWSDIVCFSIEGNTMM